ncbi:MAG: extracellular solute-binding protein [Lachnospiraceae bacterium]|nr:extracellular solute-binding protein [Lachnospiraceae bacterium]
MKNLLKKGIALTLAAVMGLSLVACGEDNTAGNNTNDTNSDYVYVPEFTKIKGEDDSHMYSPFLHGDRLYYSSYSFDETTGEHTQNVRYRELSDINTEKILEIPTFEIEEGKYSADMGNFTFDKEGNLYAIWNAYPIYVEGEEYDYNANTVYLCKYDSSMQQLYTQNIKEAFTDEQNSYIQYLVADKEGNVYGSSNNVIYMFDKEGAFKKVIDLNTDWIEKLFTIGDGRLFVSYYGMNGPELIELDTVSGTSKSSYKNVPDMYNCVPKEGSEGKLLITGSSKLYEYDLATQESSVILDWLQCNIDGSSVRDVVLLEDGKIGAYCDDYSGSLEWALLTKTEASKVAKKEIITLATLYEGNSDLQRAIVDFNKKNSQYQIQIKSYIDSTAEWTETTYSDAQARLNADLVSKECPDIIDLTSVNWEELVSKGALEDLAPYMEKSTVAKMEDFEPNVLAAYNVDGKQLTVPLSFMLSTVMGKKSIVGEKPGWKLQDVLDLVKEHPEAQLMRYVNKAAALQLCLFYSSESFIDYENGTCNFDSPEFVNVLEFANNFPEEITDTETSFPTMVQTGQILLTDLSFSDVQQYQMYHLMYEGEGVCIGYPTADGSAGVFLQGYDIYGISAQSKHKDGAWKFMETMLAEKEEDHIWNFPSRKSSLEKLFEEAMKKEYEYDFDGEIIKDENGNPKERPKTTWGYDDWEAEIYAATQEEIDAIKDMIAMAKLPAGSDLTVIQMIYEDAEPYFKGQKSAEEVAKIIQSRLDIYISENQ